jgi:hypothetical protein
MRDLGFAGISKTLYTLPGESSTNGDYQTYSGIAWLESGSVSIGRNTGNEVIPAGALVYLCMPPLQSPMRNRELPSGHSHISPNNAGSGMPTGKYVMMTKPFDPFDYSAQLQTCSALFLTSSAADHNPGILDMSFESLYTSGPRVKRNSDAQQAAGALWFGIFGIFFGVLEELMLSPAANAILMTRGTPRVRELTLPLMDIMGVMKTRYDEKELALKCVHNVLLHDVHGSTNRTVALNVFKERNNTVFMADGKTLKTTASDDVRYARMRRDALTNIMGCEGNMAYERNRWVIGRAMHTAYPKQTLDIVIGDHNRPLSK